MKDDSDIRICFFGDSFVNGTGDTECLGWAGRVCQVANSKGSKITFYNLGVRRDTSADVRLRWKREAANRLEGPFNGRIVFSFGVNDSAMVGGKQRISFGDSVKNLRAIITTAKKKHDTLVIGPPPVSDQEHSKRIGQLSTAYAAAAKKLGVPYLDTFTPLSKSALWMEEIDGHDMYHPDGGGYTLFAAVVLEWEQWWFR